MAYQFIESDNGHDYQLVWTRRIRGPKRCGVYLDFNESLRRLDITVEYKGDRVASTFKGPSEATGLVRLLKKMGIRKRDLQAATFPDSRQDMLIDRWGHLVSWLATCNECK